jgi:hypothetical protein
LDPSSFKKVDAPLKKKKLKIEADAVEQKAVETDINQEQKVEEELPGEGAASILKKER